MGTGGAVCSDQGVPVREAGIKDPFHQFTLENPAYSALRKDRQMIKYVGEGIVVQGCAYGGRLHDEAHSLGRGTNSGCRRRRWRCS